jgi:hypothetical protein
MKGQSNADGRAAYQRRSKPVRVNAVILVHTAGAPRLPVSALPHCDRNWARLVRRGPLDVVDDDDLRLRLRRLEF